MYGSSSNNVKMVLLIIVVLEMILLFSLTLVKQNSEDSDNDNKSSLSSNNGKVIYSDEKKIYPSNSEESDSLVGVFKNEALAMINAAEHMYNEISLINTNLYKNTKNNYCEGDQIVLDDGLRMNVENSLLDAGYAHKSDGGCSTSSHRGFCVTLSGLVNNGYIDKDLYNYAGVVLVEVPYDGSPTKYMIWMHNTKYGINGVEKDKIASLKYTSTNDTHPSEGTEAYNTSSPNGGVLGVVTRLDGIKTVIKKTYGDKDALGVLKSGTGTGDVANASNNSLYASLTSSTYHGGTGNFYYMPCINEKIDW